MFCVVPPVVIRNDEWTWEEAYHYLYEDVAFDNIVISPGPGSPMCPADIGISKLILFLLKLCLSFLKLHFCSAGICLRLLLECRDIPILGVCLGHQVILSS